MPKNHNQISNEKWLARDYAAMKKSQSKLNKTQRMDFKSEKKKLDDKKQME